MYAYMIKLVILYHTYASNGANEMALRIYGMKDHVHDEATPFWENTF